MPNFTEITSEQLFRLTGLPDQPVVIDVRTDEDFARDPRLIPGSVRRPHRDAAPGFETRHVVVVCQKGLKLSHGVAAELRLAGTRAEVLEGGFVLWAERGLPLMPAAALPAGSTWVTRHRPKIDRIACPWLIRRFVDRGARFLFVAPSEVLAVAEWFEAIPFDVEGTEWSHQGDRCTFDTMIAGWGLSTPALDRLAAVVRGADTNRHDLAPECAGLLALSVGLSRQFRDDLQQLEAGLSLFDALYRWARDGYEEGHDWPVTRQ